MDPRLGTLRKLAVVDILLVTQLRMSSSVADQVHIGHTLGDLAHLRHGPNLVCWGIVV